MSESADRRPEWLRRKHGKQRSEPYLDLIAAAPRCHVRGDGAHEHSIVIAAVAGLDGNERPLADDDEARNVANALYRSRPRGEGGEFLVSIPKPQRVRHADGTWEVRCCVHDKHEGDDWMGAHPDRKTYDPAARTAQAATRKPPRRRRPTKTEQREHEEAEARRRHYADKLATAPIGGDGDYRIWALDHGHRAPASPQEQQRRDAVVTARLKAQQEARRQAKTQAADRGETPVTKAAKAAATWWKSLS